MIQETIQLTRVLGISRLWRLMRTYRFVWKDTLQGFYTTRTMQTLFNVGFFDVIQTNGVVNTDRFAEDRGLDPHILAALCNSLYAMRILDQSSEGYVLSPKGRLMVEVGRGWFDGVYGYEEMYHELEALLRKHKVYGEDIYRKPDFVAKGSGEIESWFYFPLAIDRITRSRGHEVLDLGCGDGTFLRYLCDRTEARGFGLDLAPEAIADAERLTRDARLSDRITYTVADVVNLDETPPEFREVDFAITFFVLHEILWQGRKAVVEVLRSYRRLFANVPLMVFEVIRPSEEAMRKRPGMMVQYLLQHELSHQKLVSRSEWRDLFAAAGFTRIDEEYFDIARTAIFTVS